MAELFTCLKAEPDFLLLHLTEAFQPILIKYSHYTEFYYIDEYTSSPAWSEAVLFEHSTNLWVEENAVVGDYF